MRGVQLEYARGDQVLRSLRLEALWFIRCGIPDWMSIEDLIHAGWLGYQEGLRRADLSRGDPHNYAKHWARGAMLAELQLWYGAGRSRDNFTIMPWGSWTVTPIAGPEGFGEEMEGPDDTAVYFQILDMLPMIPEREGKAVYMRYEQGLAFSGIAAELGISRNHARVVTLAGVRMLRELLIDHPLQRSVAA